MGKVIYIYSKHDHKYPTIMPLVTTYKLQ